MGIEDIKVSITTKLVNKEEFAEVLSRNTHLYTYYTSDTEPTRLVPKEDTKYQRWFYEPSTGVTFICTDKF